MVIKLEFFLQCNFTENCSQWQYDFEYYLFLYINHILYDTSYVIHDTLLYILYILSANYRVKALRAYHFGDWNQLTILAFFTKCAWMLMRWIKLMHR